MYLLSPTDPEFAVVAKKFIEVVMENFGTGTTKAIGLKLQTKNSGLLEIIVVGFSEECAQELP